MRLSRTICFLAALFASPLWADVKPHALFTDKMVLQRNMPLPVWGTSEPGDEVTVQLEVKTADGKRNESVSVKAGGDGKWMAKLPAFPVGTEGALTIRGKADSKPHVFKDVLVGDVWVCSGQSNMEWSLASTPKAGGPEEIKKSANPMIRLFSVPKFAVAEPQKGFNPQLPSANHAKWLHCTPETSAWFSAVGYYFGRDLQKALNVPIGLIHTSWGGTPAEAWTSKESLAADSTLKYYVDQLAKRQEGYSPEKAKEQFEVALAKFKVAAEEAKAAKKPAPRAPQLARAPGTNPNDPSSLYNGMIEPLLPFAIKGAIWYQGESNAGKPIEYRTLFTAMISDWRKKWGYEFPFFCVQLAPFNAGNPEGENWAFLREAQFLATRKLKSVGMAVITDAGDPTDIHPQAKEPVGARLALSARAIAYGEKIEHTGPLYKSMKVNGDSIVIEFDNVGDGLVAKDGELKGFTIAGDDHKFAPAKAKIEGNTVIVVAESVKKPVAVRFAWKNFPVVNLFSKSGLPANPFRTDDLPFGK